jgi:hypothetical protein
VKALFIRNSAEGIIRIDALVADGKFSEFVILSELFNSLLC